MLASLFGAGPLRAQQNEDQKLLASDGVAGDEFGYGVSVSEDTAVIGARRDDGALANDYGSAHGLVRAGGVWTEQQKLLASDGAAADLFGSSVPLSGDTALIGAPDSFPTIATKKIGCGETAGTLWVYSRHLAVA